MLVDLSRGFNLLEKWVFFVLFCYGTSCLETSLLSTFVLSFYVHIHVRVILYFLQIILYETKDFFYVNGCFSYRGEISAFNRKCLFDEIAV